ncbi:MAG: HlyC/CorC family transporter, partial [Deltaproteobacteria bacterium]
MDDLSHSVDTVAVAWRLAATAFFIALNAFFVASEFALVKIRPVRLDSLASEGRRSAKIARHLVDHLPLYLSACQVGVTVASLAIGWLGEPAVSFLIAGLLNTVGLGVAADSPALGAFSIFFAFVVITAVHMIIGEQVPKLWALEKVESTALAVSRPLKLFATACGPFINFVNGTANFILESVGVPVRGLKEGTHTADEISAILAASARAGHISERQREFAENVLGIVELEVRHILVPRGEVVHLALDKPPEENLKIIRTTGHSRFPLCRHDLDDVIGFVHAKDVLRALIDSEQLDL